MVPLAAAVAVLTGDRRVLDESIRPDAANMLLPDLGFTSEQLDQSRAAVVDALIRHRDAGSTAAPLPTDDAIDEIIEWMTGGMDVTEQLPMFREELDVRSEDQRAPGWTIGEVAPDREIHVVIIGAGMSGIAAAHRLRQTGVTVTVLEKNGDVGGTWLENTYPGCRVDVPTFFYSYSFAQRADWPETYSRQDVLLDYFRSVVDDFGLRSLIRFDTEVTSATWDDDATQWHLEIVDHAGESTVTADIVVSAVGQLNRPAYPAIVGIDTFEGESFHSARWDHDVELAGKRVAVIGTGCSAAQFIPTVAEQAGHLTIFQRTPNWLAPAESLADEIGSGVRWLFDHVPSFAHWWRLFQFWRLAEGMVPAAEVDPDWAGEGTVSELNAFVRDVFMEHLQATFGDRPDLLAKVTPDYPPIAKRVVRDDGIWAATLKRDDVVLDTSPISAVTATGVRTALAQESDRVDDVDHDVDVIIYGTGFRAADFLLPMKVVGRDGADLHDTWDGDARAFMGMTVPAFPNLFCLYGPNTNVVVNGSIIFFSEAEVHLLTEAVRMLADTGHRAMECRPEAHDAYNARIDAGNLTKAWGVSDVSSWYKNRYGRVAQNWPFSLHEFWRQTRAIEPDDYRWS